MKPVALIGFWVLKNINLHACRSHVDIGHPVSQARDWGKSNLALQASINDTMPCSLSQPEPNLVFEGTSGEEKEEEEKMKKKRKGKGERKKRRRGR